VPGEVYDPSPNGAFWHAPSHFPRMARALRASGRTLRAGRPGRTISTIVARPATPGRKRRGKPIHGLTDLNLSHCSYTTAPRQRNPREDAVRRMCGLGCSDHSDRDANPEGAGGKKRASLFTMEYPVAFFMSRTIAAHYRRFCLFCNTVYRRDASGACAVQAGWATRGTDGEGAAATRAVIRWWVGRVL
jgi:hypothetical protein